jgi:hypothetical protein
MEFARVVGPPSFVPQVTREHLDASADALRQLCELATMVPMRPDEPVLDVRVGHYDHGAFLTLALSGFAVLDTTSDGRLLPVGEGSPVRYAVVVNRSVDDQISQTRTFLGSLVARQAVTRAMRRGEGDIGGACAWLAAGDVVPGVALAFLRTKGVRLHAHDH